MDRRRFLLTVGAAGLGGLAGCRQGSDLSENDYDVGMSSRDFQPETTVIQPGDTVVWGNTSAPVHTVTAYGNRIPDEADYFASGGFGSEQATLQGWQDGNGGIAQGDTFEHTFEVPGEYHYYCIPHEAAQMKGLVRVTEGGSDSTTPTSTADE